MRKLTLLLLLFICSYLSLHAQTYFNEWIDYNKTYYKIKVAKDGVYRISASTLQDLELDGLSGRGFKMYHKGQEIPIYTTTNVGFGTNDYIEFIGDKNDGEFDTQLHADPEWQVSTEYSLFSDTVAYFLTWDLNTTNKRFENADNDLTGNLPESEKYFMDKSLEIHANAHYTGKPSRFPGVNYNFADFEDGEGFVSTTFDNGETTVYTLDTPSPYQGADAAPVQLECKVVGRNDDFAHIPDHHVRIQVNNTLYIDRTFDGYDHNVYRFDNVFLTDIGAETTDVTYQAVGDIATNDIISTAYTQITYPREFNLNNERNYRLQLNHNDDTYLLIFNYNAGNAPILYDLTNEKRIIPVEENGFLRIHLEAGNNVNEKRQIVLANTTSMVCLNSNAHCFFNLSSEQLIPTQFTDYSQAANQGNYIMITHPFLEQGTTNWVQEYVEYRASTEGGNYSVVKVNIEDLYDQYAWGIGKHPLAIRHFINQAVDTWGANPQHLLLLGKSIVYSKVRTNKLAYEECLIPTYGQVASDNVLTSRDIHTYRLQMAVGRVSANTPEEVRAYLEKLIEYETGIPCNREDRAWTKDIVHISIGNNMNEETEFVNYLNDYKAIVEDTLYGGEVISTYSSGVKNPNISFPGLATQMTEGLGLLTLMGHSNAGGWWAFDFAEPEIYQNEGKYPYVVSGSCFVGNIHLFSSPSMAERYVLADNHGSIAFLSTVSFGFPTILDIFCSELYKQFSYKNYGQTMGYCIWQALNEIYVANPDDVVNYEPIKATSEEYTLEGDPAVKLIGNFERPEFLVENNATYEDVKLVNPNTQTQLTGSPIVIEDLNSVEFQITATNVGMAINQPFNIQIVRELPDGTTEVVANETYPPLLSEETFTITVNNLNPNETVGLNNFTIILDGDNAADEDCEDNNSVTIPVFVQAGACGGVAQPQIDANLPTTYCTNDNAIQLAATPAGGEFNGPGVVNNMFDPALAGIGSHSINYTYVDSDTGCQVADATTFTVLEVPIAEIKDVSTTAVCVGDAITFEAVNILGGTFNWNFDGGEIFEGTGAGPYVIRWENGGNKNITLTVTRDNCTSTLVSTNVLIDQPLAVPVVNCTSDATSVNFSWDPVPNATNYIVSINGGTSFTTVGTSLDQTGLTSGEEIVLTITAAGNGPCGDSESTSVICTAQNCAPITPIIENLSTQYCVGDASITLTGTPTGGSFTINDQAATNFDPAVAGTYNILYRYIDGNCNYASQTYTVEVTENPAPVISGTSFVCANGSVTLEAQRTFLTYEWNTGETTATIDITEAGTYSVIVTDENGCQGTDSFDITSAPEREVFIIPQGPPVLCAAGSQLTLLATPGFENYEWSVIGAGNESEYIISAPGDYSVTATDENGCRWINDITIGESEVAEPTILVNGEQTTQICSGGTATLDAGAGYFSYEWTGGLTAQFLDITESGEYSVTVTNELGCEAVQRIDITIANVDAPAIESSTNLICEGEELALTATAGYDNYTWSTGDDGQQVSISTAGNYTVTAFRDGCEVTSEVFEVSIDPSSIPTASFSVEKPDEVCVGEAITFDNVSENASVYNWTFTNETTGESFTNEDKTPIITFEEVGSYTISLTVTASCGTKTEASTLSNYLTVGTLPEVTIADVGSGLVCAGVTTTLSAEGTADNYVWTDVVTNTQIGTGASIEVSPTAETMYTLTAFNNTGGCAKVETVTLSVRENCEIPNAITPNDDGFNDSWQIPQAFSNTNVTVEIYNRWGQKVYNQSGYSNSNGWEGTNNGGKELAHGTYYYVIFLNDGTEPLAGHVTILK